MTVKSIAGAKIIPAMLIFSFSTGCLGVLGNMARGYDTTALEPIEVSGATYEVEQRTRVSDLSQPATGENLTVAVYTKAFGTWVYCGRSRSGCEAAVREHQRSANKSMY